MDTIECPVCGYPSAEKQATYDPVTVFYICPVCGRYEFAELIEAAKVVLQRRSVDKRSTSMSPYIICSDIWNRSASFIILPFS